MPTKYRLFLMLMPFLALVAVFAYLPLWGWRYAFFDYKVGDSISMENFVGFKWFTELFKNPATVRDIVRVLKNTRTWNRNKLASHGLCHIPVGNKKYKIPKICTDSNNSS